MQLPARRPRHADEVESADRRWLLAAIAVFVTAIGGLLVARMIYRATGPHPEVRVFLRRLKTYLKQILPRWRRIKADP